VQGCRDESVAFLEASERMADAGVWVVDRGSNGI